MRRSLINRAAGLLAKLFGIPQRGASKRRCSCRRMPYLGALGLSLYAISFVDNM